MSTNLSIEELIEKQRQLVFAPNPKLNIVAPCTIGNGILKLSESEVELYNQIFKNHKKHICFFIPASGSGSRMFEFLYDFIESPDENNRAQVERFINKIESFAFFRQLPRDKQIEILEFKISIQEIVQFLLNNNGMGYGELPKGLIPFHVVEPFVLNPFQEHIIQGSLLNSSETTFHFTIQAQFTEKFNSVVEQLQGTTGKQFQVSYSEQNKETDSFAFEDDGSVAINNDGAPLRRPAGHGALLENLQSIESDLVFVKNIDNIQHYNQSFKSRQLWNALGGLILEVKKELEELKKAPNLLLLNQINQKFDIFSKQEIENLTNEESIIKLINRPIRVCGMVRNEGQPGGGPFLVEENGVVKKQIVEKAQIGSSQDQYNHMIKSTHFNPVMMVLSYRQDNGENYNLKDFSDESKYFIVQKKQQGKNIRFMELPGLWNGAMSSWLTIFVEVPNETFSPVKTVLDLLNPAHNPTE